MPADLSHPVPSPKPAEVLEHPAAIASQSPEAPVGRLIRQTGSDGLFARLAVSKATGHRLAAAGRIGPRPIRLTRTSVRYDLAEVLAWLAHRRPDGQLHDARTWPAVWAAILKSLRK
jgi:predicted DNA-binding transcriptional regulator AlpA